MSLVRPNGMPPASGLRKMSKMCLVVSRGEAIGIPCNPPRVGEGLQGDGRLSAPAFVTAPRRRIVGLDHRVDEVAAALADDRSTPFERGGQFLGGRDLLAGEALGLGEAHQIGARLVDLQADPAVLRRPVAEAGDVMLMRLSVVERVVEGR